jgi:hypothetical protein
LLTLRVGFEAPRSAASVSLAKIVVSTLARTKLSVLDPTQERRVKDRATTPGTKTHGEAGRRLRSRLFFDFSNIRRQSAVPPLVDVCVNLGWTIRRNLQNIFSISLIQLLSASKGLLHSTF